MSFQTYHLSNGIRVFIKTIPTSFKVCMDILVGAGSQCDPSDKKGLAHFVEHMMFRGTEQRSYKQISIDTLKIGGYLNAFTERDTTTYTLDVPSRQWKNAVSILLDLYLNPIFPVVDIAKERSIIQEEIDMYNDIPSEYLLDQFTELLYGGHNFSSPILGTRESVATITNQDVESFYRYWYFDETLTISITGQIKAEEILPILEEKLGKRTISKREKPAPALNNQASHERFYYRDVDQAQMLLGVWAPGLEDKDAAAIAVMDAVLGGNEISRLFQYIREERGLAYAVDTSYEAWLGTGCFLVSVGLDYRRIAEVKQIILDEWERMTRELITDEELTIAKNALEGIKIMSLEGAGAYNSFMGAMAVRGLPADPEKELQEILQVTAVDVQRVAKRILNTKNYVFAVLLPNNKLDK